MSSTTQKEEKADLEARVNDNFYDEYHERMYQAHKVVIDAKQYILKHWEKIDDWSQLNVVLYDRQEDEKVRYGDFSKYKDHSDSVIRKALYHMHNPMGAIEEVVWDDVDGDFSVTVDGRQFLWISDGAIIKIADYIEQRLDKLKEQEKDGK